MSHGSPQNPRPGRRSYRQYLSRRRHQAHDLAAAQAGAAQRPDIPDHPLICPDPPIIITTQPQLDEAIAYLAAQSRFAYDTEFIGETHYRPNLCLIQFATPQRIYLVDPLGTHDNDPDEQTDEDGTESEPSPDPALDLTGMWELLADPSVEKIVHAGQPDLEPIVRHIQKPPAGVFDTQIAAGFVGDAYPMSLENLIAAYLKIELPKAMTFTKWDQRPLLDVHLHYAADDVRYLPALRDAIGKRLDAQGRMSWAQAEFQSLCKTEQYLFNPDAIVARLRRTHAIAHRNALLLRKLVVMRDQIAQHRDLPPRSILRDKALVDLARQAPMTPDKLKEIASVPASFRSTHETTILRATTRASKSRDWIEPPPRQRPLTDRQRQQVDDLWATVKALCEQRRIAVGIVTSRHEFSELARLAIRNKPIDPEHPLLTGWRRELLDEVLGPMLQAAPPED